MQNERISAYRIGGDEFCVILEKTNAVEIHQILDSLERKINVYNEKNNIKISYAKGYEISTREHYYLIEELTKRADSRMYENKRLMKGKKIGWQKVKRMITGIVVALLLAVIVFQYMIIKIDKDKRHEAGHDKLTGLCNPEHLMQKMKELPDKKKNRLIIYSDIAEFKLINEIFGIEKGNEILLKQADIIKKHAVDGYLYGRVGEDHFVVIADEATFNEEHLYECRETLQNVLSDSVYNVRVCFGIYRTDNMNESLSFMCDKASFAVASIKDDTHSFIAYYDDTMLEAAIKYKTIVDEFDDAIKASEFKMYLQPQISAKTRRLTGAEALVRRIKPDGTIVSPIDFIPVYEKSGLISRLDRYIWEQAAAKLGEWKKAGINMSISVNISPKDFYYIDIFNTFAGLIKKYDIEPSNLKIEITETTIMSDVPNLMGELEELRKAGFTIEMDDFGSGYSSLNTLKDINVDVLKVDMGFIKETKNVKKSRIILASVIKMAKELNLLIITEGVETEEQVDNLTKLGCDVFQGYYFSKAIDVNEFEKRYLYRKKAG